MPHIFRAFNRKPFLKAVYQHLINPSFSQCAHGRFASLTKFFRTNLNTVSENADDN